MTEIDPVTIVDTLPKVYVGFDTRFPGKIAVDPDSRVAEYMEILPGAYWKSKQCLWTLPLSWVSVYLLQKTFPGLLHPTEEFVEWAIDSKEVLDRLEHARSNPLDTTGLDAEFSSHPLSMLKGYQRVGAVSIADAEAYLLFDEMGTGKTFTALGGMRLLHERGEDIFPLLITAPKSVVLEWEKQAKVFFPDHRVVAAAGTAKKIQEALESDADVYVLGIDSLRGYSRLSGYGSMKLTTEQKTPKVLNTKQWNSFIADEAHRLKSPKSQSTRAMWATTADARFRVVMTGTPQESSPEDLWGLLRLTLPELFGRKTQFRDRYLAVTYDHFGYPTVEGINPDFHEEFLKILDGHSRRVTKTIALPDLPPKIFETRSVEMSATQARAYNSLAKDFVARVESGEVLSASTVLEQATRLIQLANSMLEQIGTDEEPQWKMTDKSSKLDAVVDDITNGDYDGESVVIYSDSRQLAELLGQRLLKKRVVFAEINGDTQEAERQAIIEKFQAGEFPFVIITNAGATGTTLSRASTMIRLTRPWSYITWQQSEDRTHRIGSEIHSVIRYVDYIVTGTVEERQISAITKKAASAEETLRDSELVRMINGEEI